MKEIGKIIKDMEKVFIYLLMVICIQATGEMMKEKEKEYLSYYNWGREIGNFTKSKKIGTFAQIDKKGQVFY